MNEKEFELLKEIMRSELAFFRNELHSHKKELDRHNREIGINKQMMEDTRLSVRQWFSAHGKENEKRLQVINDSISNLLTSFLAFGDDVKSQIKDFVEQIKELTRAINEKPCTEHGNNQRWYWVFLCLLASACGAGFVWLASFHVTIPFLN